MEDENYNQQKGAEIAPRVSGLPEQNKKGMYRRLAWWCGLAPLVAFLLTVYVWGILNLLTSASNTQSEFVIFTTRVSIPFILAILPFTLPIGIILAVYFVFKAKRTPANPDIIKPKRSWWKTAGVALFIVLILILIPIITVSIATATYKHNCGFGGCSPTTLPHINTVPKVPTVDLDEKRSSDSRSQTLDSLGELTLRNVRSQAEIYAYDQFEISYKGFCETLKSAQPGLSSFECTDDKDRWAVHGILAGSDRVRCVDSTGSLVDGVFSQSTGYCLKGSGQNDSVAGDESKKELSESELDFITNQSIDVINSFASGHQGLEITDISVDKSFQIGRNEFNGGKFTVETKHIVIKIVGEADERVALISSATEPTSLWSFLKSVPSFTVIFPSGTITTVADIQFEMLVLLDTEMF